MGINVLYNVSMGSGRGRARRVRSIMPKSLSRSLAGFAPNPPNDVHVEGKHVLMPWQNPRGYGGNPGDMFWLASTEEFVVLHNKYVPVKVRGDGGFPRIVEGRYREMYRGGDLGEALGAMWEIASLENCECAPTRALVAEQAEKMGFSSKLEPVPAGSVERVEF